MSENWDYSWTNNQNAKSTNSYSNANNKTFRRETSSRQKNWSKEKITHFDSKTLIQVPSDFVGRIIGRGGSKISDLQCNSGAKIKVTKDTEENFTFVEIIGSEENIEKAKKMIEELIKDRPSFTFVSNNLANNVQDTIPLVPINWKALAEESEKFQKQQFANLRSVKKNFYEEDPVIAKMGIQEVEAFRNANNNIVVSRLCKEDKGEKKSILNPVTTFEQAFKKFPEILEEIAKQGFECPSPIQSQAWPVLLNGEDLIGIAQTGTEIPFIDTFLQDESLQEGDAFLTP